MVEIKLVEYCEYKDELLDLFRASFGHDMSVKRWDWQFTHNPLASEIPDVCVAVDNNRIIAARPHMASKIWMGHENIKAVQRVNSMVHPGYQRQGIFSRMTHPVGDYLKTKNYAVHYGFPNSRVQPILLR